MAGFAGFSAQDLASYFGFSPAVAQGVIDLYGGGSVSAADKTALQGVDPNRFAPGATGPNQGYGDITWGLEHLNEHPKGSKYHGDFNVTDTLANIGTGGLYGLGKAGLSAVEGKQDLLGAGLSGLNQLGPWGASTYGIPGYGPQIAQTGNLIGAGAGIGAAGGIGGGGFGAESSAPYYAGSNIPFLTDSAGNAGMSVAFDPITGAAGPGAGITPAGYAAGASMGGASGAAGGFGPGGSGLGATLGAGAGQQAMSLFAGGASPLSLPQGGGMGGAIGKPGGLTPQQLAALTAQQSQAHQGLAPQFQARMAGSREAPGISTLSQLYGQGGQ